MGFGLLSRPCPCKKICNTLKVIEHPKMHSMVSSRTSACLYGLDQRSDDATVMRKNDMSTALLTFIHPNSVLKL